MSSRKGRFTRRAVVKGRRSSGALLHPSARSPFEPLEQRWMLAHDPVIVLPFNEPVGSDQVTDTAPAGGVVTGDFAGDVLPEIRNTDPSPAGGNYVHFEGSGVFSADPANPSSGGRIQMSQPLNPILGDTSSLSFYIRTSQSGMANAWQSPGVTGAEQAGGGSDVFWGNMDPAGQSRIVAGNGAGAASTPINDGATWYNITQTRNATSGVVNTYVNGILVSQATGETGVKLASFSVIGATTNVAIDLTTIQGYTHLNGDLDQVEIYNRELNPVEIVQFYGAPAAAVPASPTPLTATANTTSQVTLNFTNVADEVGYVIRRGTAAGGPFTDIGNLAADATTFVDRNLTAGTQYFYQVVAFNQKGESTPASTSVTTPLPGVDPVLVYNFNENTGTRVEDISAENVDNDGTLTGDVLPEWRTTSPSPAGGSYLHFEGSGTYKGSGARVDTDDLLNPILGRSATLAYYVRTEQAGQANAWESPGVTGAEQAGGGSDIFWGNLDPEGRARVQADDGAAAASTPLPAAGWVRVVHTRDLTTGVVRTYVNGNVVSEAVSTPGEMLANFKAIGATTDVAGDLTTIEGYNYLQGDLDQIEIYDRALTPQEVAQRYGPTATAVPGSPAPATATADSPTQITVNFTNVPGETGYIIQRATSAAGPFTQLAVVAPDSTSYVDTGLAFETQYFYQVIPFNSQGSGNAATANATTGFPANNPIVVYNFEDPAAGTTVDNTGSGGEQYDGTLAGDQLPTFGTTGASPAGGQYMHFAVSAPGADAAAPTFENHGGRVDSATLLNPILGGNSSISYFIRTTQTGHADAWRSPGVTGAEQAGGGNDIFWGNLDATGHARLVAGNGAAAATTDPVNTGQWVQVVHTRNATTGVENTYVNGVLVSTATGETGVKGANFSSIGATTDVAGNLTDVQGYNYLDGDLDQVAIYDRELTPVEITRFFGGAGQVSQVYVRGSTWSSAFKTYMAGQGLGDANLGYRVDNRTASDLVPWINVDEIVLRYSAPPTGGGVPAPGTLVLDGVRSDYTVTTVTALDPQTFVLRLDRPLGNLPTPPGGENGDRIKMTVPGGGPGGAAYVRTINVLQGDVDRNGSVVANDFSDVKKKFFKSTANPGAGDTGYTVFHDVDGSGSIVANDFSEVKKRFFDNLPAAPASASSPGAGASITQSLFGAKSILA